MNTNHKKNTVYIFFSHVEIAQVIVFDLVGQLHSLLEAF